MTKVTGAVDNTLAGRARRFAQLIRRIDRIKKLEKAAKKEQNDLGETIVAMLTDSGIDSIKIDGAVTIHLIEQIFPVQVVPPGMTKTEAKYRVVECLIEMGRTALVGINAQSIKKLLRELADEDGAIPGELGLVLRAERRIKLGARGARGAKKEAEDDDEESDY